MKKYDKPVASYCLSNNASINIYEIVYGVDTVIKWSFNNMRVNTSRVKDSEIGACDQYFIALGRKIPLSECMMIHEK